MAVSRTSSDVHVIPVSGEVDLSSTPKLVARLDRALAEEPAAILVDLCDVTFMDSTGLNCLVAARRRSKAAGTRMAIACTPDGGIAEVLDLTTLNRVFEVYDDRETALRALRSQRP